MSGHHRKHWTRYNVGMSDFPLHFGLMTHRAMQAIELHGYRMVSGIAAYGMDAAGEFTHRVQVLSAGVHARPDVENTEWPDSMSTPDCIDSLPTTYINAGIGTATSQLNVIPTIQDTGWIKCDLVLPFLSWRLYGSNQTGLNQRTNFLLGVEYTWSKELSVGEMAEVFANWGLDMQDGDYNSTEWQGFPAAELR